MTLIFEIIKGIIIIIKGKEIKQTKLKKLNWSILTQRKIGYRIGLVFRQNIT